MANETIVKIELDACEPEALLSGEAMPEGVFVRLADPSGEGLGGWPVVELLGPADALAAYVADKWNIDRETFDDLVEVLQT